MGESEDRLKERDWAELRQEDKKREKDNGRNNRSQHKSHGKRRRQSDNRSRSPRHHRGHHDRRSRSRSRSASQHREHSQQRSGSSHERRNGKRSASRDGSKSRSRSRSRTRHSRRHRHSSHSRSRSHSPRRRHQYRRDSRDRRHSHRGGRGDRGRGDRGRGSRGGRGGRGRGGFHEERPYTTNKAKHVERAESNDPEQIRRQVEFYFSEANLHRDAFLLERTEGPTNKSIPIKAITDFSRMRHFKPYQDVVKALRESSSLEVIDAGVPGTEEIKRKTPISSEYSADRADIPENERIFRDKVLARTAVVYGWKEEHTNHQEEVENFLRPMGNNILSIRLARSRYRNFQGRADIIFEDIEDMESFVEMFEGGKQYDKDESMLYAMTKQKHLEEFDARSSDKEEKDRVENGVGDKASTQDENAELSKSGEAELEKDAQGEETNQTSGSQGKEPMADVSAKRADDKDVAYDDEGHDAKRTGDGEEGAPEQKSDKTSVNSDKVPLTSNNGKRARDESIPAEGDEPDTKRTRQEEQDEAAVVDGAEAK